MPNTKISNLTSAGTLSGTEEIPIVQSGTTVKTTAQDIANLGGPKGIYRYVTDGLGNVTQTTIAAVPGFNAFAVINNGVFLVQESSFGLNLGVAVCSSGFNQANTQPFFLIQLAPGTGVFGFLELMATTQFFSIDLSTTATNDCGFIVSYYTL